VANYQPYLAVEEPFAKYSLEFANRLGLLGLDLTKDPLHPMDRRAFKANFLLPAAKLSWEEEKMKFIEEARDSGATAMGDARKNIKRSNQESVVVAGPSSYLPIRTFNMGDTEKNSENLFTAYEETFVLHGEAKDIAEVIIAFVCDNAKNIAGMARRLQERHSVLYIKCGAHSFSLVVKHIFKNIERFSYYVDRMEEVTHFFRATKASDMLDGMSVFRVIDTRFASIVLAALRLLKMQYKLRSAASSVKFSPDPFPIPSSDQLPGAC